MGEYVVCHRRDHRSTACTFLYSLAMQAETPNPPAEQIGSDMIERRHSWAREQGGRAARGRRRQRRKRSDRRRWVIDEDMAAIYA